jgi:HEAT repeat protein
VQAQIRADRYYAAHLLGDLKDPRAVDLLMPLLNDDDVDDVVPWSLAEIGDRRAIGSLIGQLERDDPSARVLAISALEKLNAREALPKLRQLLQDNRRSNFGDRTPVAEAAKRAIALISHPGLRRTHSAACVRAVGAGPARLQAAAAAAVLPGRHRVRRNSIQSNRHNGATFQLLGAGSEC